MEVRRTKNFSKKPSNSKLSEDTDSQSIWSPKSWTVSCGISFAKRVNFLDWWRSGHLSRNRPVCHASLSFTGRVWSALKTDLFRSRSHRRFSNGSYYLHSTRFSTHSTHFYERHLSPSRSHANESNNLPHPSIAHWQYHTRCRPREHARTHHHQVSLSSAHRLTPSSSLSHTHTHTRRTHAHWRRCFQKIPCFLCRSRHKAASNATAKKVKTDRQPTASKIGFAVWRVEADRKKTSLTTVWQNFKFNQQIRSTLISSRTSWQKLK